MGQKNSLYARISDRIIEHMHPANIKLYNTYIVNCTSKTIKHFLHALNKGFILHTF